MQKSSDSTTRRTGLLLGPVVLAVLLAIPIPGISPEAHRLAAIMGLVVTWWVTEAIPLAATALLGPALCIVLGVAPDRAVLAPFASPITFLFIGSFLLAESMQKHGLDRRIALRLLLIPAVSSTPGRLFGCLALLTAGLSMWMSNSATTAMMLPIAIGALRAWPAFRDHPSAASSLVLLIAFSASIGGLGTPVGTPPNLIGLSHIRELLGIRIPFVHWMIAGLPIVLLQIAFLLFLLRPAGRGSAASHGDSAEARREIASQLAALRPWSAGERNTVIAFSFAVALWVIPGLLELIAGLTGTTGGILESARTLLASRLPEETVGLLAGVSLLLLPVSWNSREMTLTWQEAARIDWGTILIFGGGMALGKLLFDTGLAEAIGRNAVAFVGGNPGLWTLVAAGILLSILVSETASNTASATVMVPVMIAVAKGAGVDPVPVALATCIACSFGFLLPVSTPPNALAYGTGLVRIPEMIRRGFALDIAGAVIVFLLFRIFWPLVPPLAPQ